MNAIEIKNLTKIYDGVKVVDNLSLTVKQGSVFSLLGLNGAGKTTTIKMLSCLLSPSNGDAELLGYSILSQPWQIKNIINVSPQETAIAGNLTVRENLEFIAQIYGQKKQEAHINASNISRELGLTEYMGKKAKILSGGMQRRLSIALALITNPKILFLDEPTLGLDILARHELWSLIRQIKVKATIVLTTHYLEEAEALSDEVAVIIKGKLTALGTVPDLLKQTNTANLENAFIVLNGGTL